MHRNLYAISNAILSFFAKKSYWIWCCQRWLAVRGKRAEKGKRQAAYARNLRATCSMCLESVPQQPPNMFMLLIRRSFIISSPNDTGSEYFRSGEPSSSLYDKGEVLAWIPRKRLRTRRFWLNGCESAWYTMFKIHKTSCTGMNDLLSELWAIVYNKKWEKSTCDGGFWWLNGIYSGIMCRNSEENSSGI